MKRFVLLVALAATFSLSGCDSNDVKDAATKATITPSTTTTADTTNDAGSDGSATASVAATGLLAAWKQNDRAAAAKVADTAAVDKIFSTKYASDTTYDKQNCEPNAGFDNQMTCSYTYSGGSMHLIMRKDDTGYKVASVEYVAD